MVDNTNSNVYSQLAGATGASVQPVQSVTPDPVVAAPVVAPVVETVPVVNVETHPTTLPVAPDVLVDKPEMNPLMDDQHHMMRYMPEGVLAEGTEKNGYKESKGPELQPPVAVAGVMPASAQEAVNLTEVSAPVSLATNTTEGLSVEETLTYKKQLDDLLSLAIEKNASDLHIAAEYPPQLRIDGKLVPIGSTEISAIRIEKIVNALLDERLAKQLDEYSDVDFSYPHKSGNRFRVNVFFTKGTLAAAFRLIPSKIKTISELNLPAIAYDLIKIPQGLILLTGPTGSGKSTSIAAMIQEINLNFNKHIITIEDPIEYVFPKAKAMVNQREIGQDAQDWQRALRELLRQDPNVVLVGEMRDFETIEATITVAETGHLVFATLHTNSASQTIDRIIDVFPEGQQNQVRSQLANVIVAVIAQRLVPLTNGGRKAVFEIMLATPGIKNAIREGKTYQIDNMIQTNAELGMITLEKSLLGLIKNGDITVDQAMTFTSKPDELLSLLNGGR